MFCANTKALCLCFVVMLCACAKKDFGSQYVERMKTMDNKKEQKSSKWLTYVNGQIISETGVFLAKDKLGTPVILEWIKTDMLSTNFSERMKSVSDIGIQAFTAVEMQFLQKHPEFVSQDKYLKPFEPFFKNGPESVNWGLVKEKMQSVIKKHFIIDPASLSEDVVKMFENDICFFVDIKDKETGMLLGFTTFLIRREYDYGDIKVTGMAVVPERQNRGLAKLLMSSVFEILPQVKRIFLCTRVTNSNALNAYRSWGFVKDLDPVQDPHYKFNLKHWIFMDYKSEQSEILQEVAKTLSK